jgi:hypothetical protein
MRCYVPTVLCCFLPFAARANPVIIDGTSLLALCIAAFWAFVVEAGIVALLLAFRGMAPLRVFGAYFVINLAVFLFVFEPLLERRWLPVPGLEAVVVGIDALGIKFLASRSPLQGEGFAEVSWFRALVVSGFGNAASYLIGYFAAQKPWVVE